MAGSPAQRRLDSPDPAAHPVTQTTAYTPYFIDRRGAWLGRATPSPMSLLNRFIKLTKQFTQNRLPTRPLIGMYSRVCYWLPDLDQETALLVAARLYLQAHPRTSRIKLVTIVG